MSKSAILCVDDETIVLESLEVQFQKTFGDTYLYEFAESADEALEIIDELAEDNVKILVIVSDWLMPGMKGDEFLICVHEKFPKIVKVMLTGQADREAIDRLRAEANLYQCFYKPWDGGELMNTIKAALESS